MNSLAGTLCSTLVFGYGLLWLSDLTLQAGKAHALFDLYNSTNTHQRLAYDAATISALDDELFPHMSPHDQEACDSEVAHANRAACENSQNDESSDSKGSCHSNGESMREPLGMNLRGSQSCAEKRAAWRRAYIDGAPELQLARESIGKQNLYRGLLAMLVGCLIVAGYVGAVENIVGHSLIR